MHGVCCTNPHGPRAVLHGRFSLSAPEFHTPHLLQLFLHFVLRSETAENPLTRRGKFYGPPAVAKNSSLSPTPPSSVQVREHSCPKRLQLL